MMRKNWRTSAGSSVRAAPRAVTAEPLMAASGARSSWLTSARNSARERSSSSSGSRSCKVTTTDSTVPSAEGIGVALSRVVTLRPSGIERTTSSERTVSKLFVFCCCGNWSSVTSRPIGAPADDRLVQLLGGKVRCAQALDDPPRLAIERLGMAAAGVEDHDAHRRGFDQGLQVGPRLLLAAVRAGVDDRRGRLRREQRQDFFIAARELRSAFLLGEKKVADQRVLVPDRRSQQGHRPYQLGGETERANVGGHVAQPERLRKLAQVLEQPRCVGPGRELAVLVRRQAGGDEALTVPGLADGRNQAVARSAQRAGAVDDLLQDGVEV